MAGRQAPYRQDSRSGPRGDQARADEDQVDRFGFGDFWSPAGYDQFGRFVDNMTRVNLEVIGWMTRQAWAYIELPSRFMRCLTPQDVIDEQRRFANDLVEGYQALTSDLVDVFTAAVLDQHRP